MTAARIRAPADPPHTANETCYHSVHWDTGQIRQQGTSVCWAQPPAQAEPAGTPDQAVQVFCLLRLCTPPGMVPARHLRATCCTGAKSISWVVRKFLSACGRFMITALAHSTEILIPHCGTSSGATVYLTWGVSNRPQEAQLMLYSWAGKNTLVIVYSIINARNTKDTHIKDTNIGIHHQKQDFKNGWIKHECWDHKHFNFLATN